MYIIHSIYFGIKIVELYKSKCKELKQIYKLPMAKKLHLGEKLLYKLLYFKQLALGIGLLQPHTIIAASALKQYFRNIRIKNNARKIIITIKDIMKIKSRYNKFPTQVVIECRFWKKC